MPVTGYDHYTVRCSDLDATWKFYEDALGLRVSERAGFPVRAAIVWLGDNQVVHLFQSQPEVEEVFARMAPKDEAEAEYPTGRILHVEFWAEGLLDMRKQLASAGVEFAERALPDKHQVTMADPDGIRIGLNFPLAEVV
jgi:catechol 2,3-dioxygenase-like lactoylglutathione lyase family enzyme